ncbi:MAG: DNA-3-methyladenine glycosylase 2 family protein [Acidobacteria bacterium]|nr:DNA-3-methyladenine glycosylase 2 family protein [Acidobacteriota bacterium]
MAQHGRGARPTPPVLTREVLARAVAELCGRDEDLGAVVARHGPPPMWAREPGFPTLVHIILEQQVSLASARAAYGRLVAAASPLTPRKFLAFDDAALRGFGFSRQKIVYVRELARAVVAGEFDPRALERMPDEEARAALVKLKGVGSWTADVYLLMALRRPDAFPAADLGLLVAAERVKRLPRRPTPDELNALAEAWRPWRAVAARVLWQHYLDGGAQHA